MACYGNNLVLNKKSIYAYVPKDINMNLDMKGNFIVCSLKINGTSNCAYECNCYDKVCRSVYIDAVDFYKTSQICEIVFSNIS